MKSLQLSFSFVRTLYRNTIFRNKINPTPAKKFNNVSPGNPRFPPKQPEIGWKRWLFWKNIYLGFQKYRWKNNFWVLVSATGDCTIFTAFANLFFRKPFRFSSCTFTTLTRCLWLAYTPVCFVWILVLNWSVRLKSWIFVRLWTTVLACTAGWIALCSGIAALGSIFRRSLVLFDSLVIEERLPSQEGRRTKTEGWLSSRLWTS